jgi:hypothetical protein
VCALVDDDADEVKEGNASAIGGGGEHLQIAPKGEDGFGSVQVRMRNMLTPSTVEAASRRRRSC